jgi:4-hydroxybenzoate polyprenyltransferase
VTAIGAVLAVLTGRDAAGMAGVTAAVLAGQLSVGWSNDAIDADRDVRAGRQDKPVAGGRIGRRTVWLAAIAAAIACVPLSLASGPVAGSLHLIAVAAAWSYNSGLKSTPLSPVPYVVAFGLLPAFVVHGLPEHPAPPIWLVAAGALLGGGAHFANVLPDLADDALTGVHGLPHLIGAGWSRTVAAGCLLAASLVLAFGPPGPPRVPGQIGLAAAAVTLGAGFALGRRPGSRAPFRAVLVVAAIDVGLLLAAGQQIR